VNFSDSQSTFLIIKYNHTFGAAEVYYIQVVYLCDTQVLVGDHLLLRDFGLYGIILMNVSVAITVVIVRRLRYSGPYATIFMNVCYNRCHGNAVAGFWALWNNIYNYVRLLLHISPSFLTGSLEVFSFTYQISSDD
jgi:hypothetical protein